MTQTLDVLRHTEKFCYTRVDFTALRAWFNRLPPLSILDLYYPEDDQEQLGLESAADLEARLIQMRDTLIQRAVDHNPHLAEAMANARRHNNWSKLAIDHLVKAADSDISRPRPDDSVSAWFKPVVASRLKEAHLSTLDELKSAITARGENWWRPIYCIGRGKAKAIEAWLQSQSKHLGELVVRRELASTGILSPIEFGGQIISLDQGYIREHTGENGYLRHRGRTLIRANSDLDALHAFLIQFIGQEKTYRAYKKELERYALWCVIERGVAMSSVSLEDCEAYKHFLADIPENWMTEKAQRASKNSGAWRPFSGQLSPTSQRYALLVIRNFYAWMTRGLYLIGNPWSFVKNPKLVKRVNAMQIEKALPKSLWDKLAGTEGILSHLASLSREDLLERYPMRGFLAAESANLQAQFRLVRAAILLLGQTGIRREEAAFAVRNMLTELPGRKVSVLKVIGKGSKEREVMIPPEVLDALSDHWTDRGLDFSYGMSETPLLSPVLLPPGIEIVSKKHLTGGLELKQSGFSPDGLYKVLKTALKRIADDDTLALDESERMHLRRIGPHAFRHTFATLAIAAGVDLDVAKTLLGHESLETTTIYVQTERERKIKAMERYFSGSC